MGACISISNILKMLLMKIICTCLPIDHLTWNPNVSVTNKQFYQLRFPKSQKQQFSLSYFCFITDKIEFKCVNIIIHFTDFNCIM